MEEKQFKLTFYYIDGNKESFTVEEIVKQTFMDALKEKDHWMTADEEIFINLNNVLKFEIKEVENESDKQSEKGTQKDSEDKKDASS